MWYVRIYIPTHLEAVDDIGPVDVCHILLEHPREELRLLLKLRLVHLEVRAEVAGQGPARDERETVNIYLLRAGELIVLVDAHGFPLTGPSLSYRVAHSQPHTHSVQG